MMGLPKLILLVCTCLGVGVFARELRQEDVCFSGSNAMSIMDFSRKALACSVEPEDGDASSELCCESVRSLFGESGSLQNCLCNPKYFTQLASQLPAESGVSVDQFIKDVQACGVPVKGDKACGGGDSAPLVTSFFLLGHPLFAGHILPNPYGSPVYVIGDDDDDDDDDGGARPVPIPPFSPIPSPSPSPSPSPPSSPPAGTSPPAGGGDSFFGGGATPSPAASPSPAAGGGDSFFGGGATPSPSAGNSTSPSPSPPAGTSPPASPSGDDDQTFFG